MAPPVRAPILISSSDGLPDPTSEALDALDPQGASATGGASAFAIGDVATPDGGKVTHVKAAAAAATAAAIAKLRDRLFGSAPKAVIVAPADRPDFAMPAAAWAARSGDPILFAAADKLPKPTLAALKRHTGVPVYVLGPSSAISSATVREIAKIDHRVHRVSGEDPVANAIAFARYVNGGFGWNVNDPGHGFVLVRSRLADRRRRRGAALRLGDLGPAAAHRQRRYPAEGVAGILSRPQARLHDQPDPRLLQPRVGDRRPGGHRREPAGGSERTGRTGQDRRRRTVSESENPDLLGAAHEVTAEDIRALAGASTPHFALQVRNRIRRLVEPLPPVHPARIEGERKIAQLEELAEHSGDPRGTLGIGH